VRRAVCGCNSTAVIDGALLRGVKFEGNVIETETVVMRSVTGTVRWIGAEHRRLDKFTWIELHLEWGPCGLGSSAFQPPF
jgi:fructose-1,6-bisphosphatase/sedoheptulose 1,7-bisphosphatase-like protein